jgi:citrate lyase subunit beta/citryl-CoA lyase
MPNPETSPDARPLRSLLYMPASNRRAIDKARGLDTDAVALDLEDAVAPEMKAERAPRCWRNWPPGASAIAA